MLHNGTPRLQYKQRNDSTAEQARRTDHSEHKRVRTEEKNEAQKLHLKNVDGNKTNCPNTLVSQVLSHAAWD